MLVFMRWVALVRLHRNPSSFSGRSCHCAVSEGVLKILQMAFACRCLSRKPHAGYGTLGLNWPSCTWYAAESHTAQPLEFTKMEGG